MKSLRHNRWTALKIKRNWSKDSFIIGLGFIVLALVGMLLSSLLGNVLAFVGVVGLGFVYGEHVGYSTGALFGGEVGFDVGRQVQRSLEELGISPAEEVTVVVEWENDILTINLRTHLPEDRLVGIESEHHDETEESP